MINKASNKLKELFQANKKANQKTSEKKSLGVDIGTTAISFVQLVERSDGIVVDKFGRAEIKKNTPIPLQIKELLTKYQVTEKRALISIKGQGVILRFISFPQMTREEFESAIQFEAEKYIPFTISDVMLDFHIVEVARAGAAPKTMDVILVAARKQEISKLIKMVQEADLQPVVVDADAIALSNAFVSTMKSAANGVCALIDFGGKNAIINIVEKGILRFSRDITFGGKDVTSFLSRKLELSEDKATEIQLSPDAANPAQLEALQQACSSMIHEIKLSLNYFQSQNQGVEPLGAIYASGGLSKMEILRQLLQKETNLPVNLWNPTESFFHGNEESNEELKKIQSCLAISMGLALRGYS